MKALGVERADEPLETVAEMLPEEGDPRVVVAATHLSNPWVTGLTSKVS
jgi:hypothetical protein